MLNKIVLISVMAFSLSGCNPNPSKEARIQKLEAEIEATREQIEALKERVQTLEGLNEELTSRITALEGA